MFQNQLVLSSIEEDVLAMGVRLQRKLMDELLESLESRDISTDEIAEMLALAERNFKKLRRHSIVK